MKKKIKKALERVEEEIRGFSSRSREQGEKINYSGGLSREGYAGGYSEALSDVLLLMNGVRPRRRNYWED
jgi:hypothetical protein